MAFGGFMNSREPPVQLPTGLPALLLRYHEFFNYPYYPVTQDNDSPCYSDTAGPTSTPTAKTSGTGTPSSPTPRTHLRLPRHRCSGGPHRHPGGQHVDERPRIHAVRVLPSDTLPGRVLPNTNFTSSRQAQPPASPSSTTSAPDNM